MTNFIRSFTVVCSLLLLINSAFAASSTLRVSAPFAAASIDPIYATTIGDTTLVTQLFEGIYTVNAQGKRVLGQAQSATISEDGLTYTFKLHPDIFWSNGDPVVAQDFVLTFQRSLDPKLDRFAKGGYLLSNFVNMKEIQAGTAKVESLGVFAPDDKTLIIKLVAPLPFLPEILTSPSASPTPHKVYEKLGENWALEKKPVSNGAYVVESKEVVEEGKYDIYTLKKNHRYFNSNSVHFDKVIQHQGTNRDRIAELADGKVDVVMLYDGKGLKWVKETLGASVVKGEHEFTTYIAFNMQDKVFGDKRVRQALALALDVEPLAARIDSFAEAARSFAPPNSRAKWVPDKREYTHWSQEQRLTKAKALLLEAGFSQENPLRAEFNYNDSAVNRRVAAALKEEWSAIGVDIKTVGLPGRIHYKNLGEHKFRIARGAWGHDIADPSDYLEKLETGHRKNYAGWSNAAYDVLVKKMRQTVQSDERIKIFAKMEKLIESEFPIIPIYHSTEAVVSRKGLVGAFYDSTITSLLRHIRPLN